MGLSNMPRPPLSSTSYRLLMSSSWMEYGSKGNAGNLSLNPACSEPGLFPRLLPLTGVVIIASDICFVARAPPRRFTVPVTRARL